MDLDGNGLLDLEEMKAAANKSNGAHQMSSEEIQ
jgi:hypothetical protein|tara:strand:+ start:83 stop:184 length:102 start_codon:yes stop_codon:yes gene_type:complete